MRAERLYQQLDLLQPLLSGCARRPAGREPQASCGEVTSPDSFDRSDSRSSLTGGLAADPRPFPHQRQLWAYSGFAVQTHDSGE